MFKGAVCESVFVGIGANMGSPAEMVELVLLELAKIAEGDVESSSIWRSEASGFEGDDFANAVAKFEYSSEPLSLLDKLQDIEVKHGRAKDHGHHTARTLDLDIIAFGQRRVLDSRLTIPHPHAHERLFVLLPLEEIDSNFRFADREGNLAQLIRDAEPLRIELWNG